MASMVLAIVQAVLFLAGTLAVIFGGGDWFHWFLAMLLWSGQSAIATVMTAIGVCADPAFRHLAN
jgi:uncharacterized membrane protein